MKNKKISLCVDLLLLLLFALPADLVQGRANGAASCGDEIVASTEEEALSGLWSLRDGQTLLLSTRDVRLNKTLLLEASNVSIRGSERRTQIHCQDGGGAFTIRGDNVTLSALTFGDCGDSALLIEGSVTLRANSRTSEVSDSESGRNRQEDHEAHVSVVDCLFQRNRAAVGGAIKVAEANLHIQATTFADNVATGYGGALHAANATVVIEGSNFSRNQATRGGAVYSKPSSTSQGNGKLTIIGSHFGNNTAKRNGGAVLVSVGQTMTVTESTFEDNAARGAVGAIGAEECQEVSVSECTFEYNTARREVGAFGAQKCQNVTISGSTFRYNTARKYGDTFEKGGAVGAFDCQNVMVTASTFEYNTAMENGGAFAASECQNVTVSEATFEYNTAKQNGGAISIASGRTTTIAKSRFEKNSADSSGGAVHVSDGQLRFCDVLLSTNRANVGGALSLTNSVSLKVLRDCNTTVFQGNVAFRGGGLSCSGCVLNENPKKLLFRENIALESGGGAFVANAQSTLSFERNFGHLRFVRNIASYGGGLALRDCSILLLTNINLKENIAIDGGGLHIVSAYGQAEFYILMNVRLRANLATSLAKMSEVKEERVSRWLEARKTFLEKGEGDWLNLDALFQGRGGGAFIALENRREDSILSLTFWTISARNNIASVGGGLYINYVARNSLRSVCVLAELIREPCLSFDFENVELTNNSASIAGGGFFVRPPHKLDIFGISERSLSPERNCSTSSENDYRVCFQGNRVLCDDGPCYGEQFATDVQSLELQNVRGPLTGLRSGERIVVRGGEHEAPPAEANITLLVKDALDQVIVGKIPDSYLCIVALSDRITGKRRYCAVNGVIEINDTSVAGVDITDNLIFQSDDERNITAALSFTLLPCQNGELPARSNSECFRCPAHSYAFEADNTRCHECEKNARCGGTTMLVPKEGYWHSTPFSPFIRRCTIKKACSFENRTKDLAKYYNATDIESKLDHVKTLVNKTSKNSFENYTQCASGYEGVLCGQCADGFGHASDGSCTRCVGSLLGTVILTLLGIGMLFVVLTGKVGLAVDGVRKQVSSDLAEERRAVASTLAQYRSSSLPSTLEHETPSCSGEAANPLSERKASDQGEIAEQPVDYGTSATAAGTQPSLQRTERQIEEPSSDSSAEEQKLPSGAISAASGLLVATYNILFNYIQLSTAALTLDIEWGVALKYLFALNGALGRVLNIEFLPLDCSFSDRDHDVGTPNSILVLWLRLCFPLITMIFYLSIVIGIKLFRGEKRMSKYKVDFLPTVRLISLVVYLAYCIDLVADLLKVFNCVDLSDDYQEGHMYAQFEHLKPDTVWLEDTSVICWEGAHLVSTVFASIGLVICLCVVVSMVVTLHRGSERRRLKNVEFVRRYGILYLGYRTDGIALHWESILTVRRMLFAWVQVHASHTETSGIQIGLLGILIFTSLALQEIVQPFVDDGAGEDFPYYAGSEVRLIVPNRLRSRWVRFNRGIGLNDLEGSSLFMALSLFLVAGCIRGEELTDVESTLLLSSCFVLNAAFFLFMLYRLWYGLHQYLDALTEENELSFTDCVDGLADRNIFLHIKLFKVLSHNNDKGKAGHSGDDNV